jgi:excisionase family DNA binding protein
MNPYDENGFKMNPNTVTMLGGTPMVPTRETYSVSELAKILGIARTSAYEAIRQGQITAVRIGRRLLVPRATVERLLKGEATRQVG